MSFRINTNTQASLALSSLNKTTNEMSTRQLRLSTGSRINSAADDSAGYTISNKLTAKTRGQAQALSNIGDAKSMMTVAEGSLGTTMDILQTIKEKAIQAGNSSMGADERAAIQSQVDELSKEVSDILSGADFNGTKLFSDSAETALSFQVGDQSGDTFGANLARMGVSTLGLGSVAAADAPAVEAQDAVQAVDASATVATPPAGTDPFANKLTLGGAYTGASDASYSFSVVDNAGTLELQDASGNAVTFSSGDLASGGTFSVDGIDVTLADYTAAAGDSFSIDATAAVAADASVTAGAGAGEAFEGAIVLGGAYDGAQDADLSFSIVDNAGTLELQDADGNAIAPSSGTLAGSDAQYTVQGITIDLTGYTAAAGDSFTIGATAAQAATAEVAAYSPPADPFADKLTLGGAYTGAEDATLSFSVVDNAGTLELQDADGNAVTWDSGDLASGGTFSVDGIEVSIAGYTAAEGDSFSINATAAVEGQEAVEAQDAVSAGDFTSSIDLTTDEGVASALTAIDAAIKKVNTAAQGLGDVQNRLDFKAQNLETSKVNYEAANSRIADADFAKEQMEIVKLQILQQTGSAMFAQSNASGQSVLSFF